MENGMKDKWERLSQVRRLREHPSAADAVPLPQWGRLRYENTAIPDTKPSPRGEGGERSEPDRVLAGWMKKSGEIVSSTSFAKVPYPPLFPTQSLPLGKADDTRIASAHKAFRHRAPYIRGEAVTFIPLPYSSRAFIGHPGTARPMSDSSNPFSDIKEKNLCV